MPQYETMLITSATLDEETSTTMVNKFKKLIETNGTIDAVEDWGKRRLAYPINKEMDGVYTLIHFTSGTDFPTELNRVYSITEGVLRYLIVAKEEGQELPAQKTEPAAQPKAQTESAAPVAATETQEAPVEQQEEK